MMKNLYVWMLAVMLLISLAGCAAPGGAQQEGLTFTYNGTGIVLHGDAAPILTALGEPRQYTEEASCAFEGLDKTYHYGSFCLSTYPADGKDYVYSIWFLDDSVMTEEGIYIGLSQKETEAILGAECFNGVNAYTKVEKTGKLTVLVTEGRVSSVQYTAVIQ